MKNLSISTIARTGVLIFALLNQILTISGHNPLPWSDEQAYEGFLKAIASENFPMCGMEESTVNLLMANIAYKLGKVDIASRFISMILTSQAASRVAKDRAMLLKEEIIAKLHGKG